MKNTYIPYDKMKYEKIRPKYRKQFYYIIILIMVVISVMLSIILVGCSQPEYQVLEIQPDIISYSNNLIKLTSETMIVLDNGMGHYDKWWIKEGVTFEIIIHEPENWTRMWPDSDFTITSGRAFTVGEGKDHLLDFTALNPPVMLYYFSIEVIINGDSTLIDYVIDSN